jgi:hypothetical protein
MLRIQGLQDGWRIDPGCTCRDANRLELSTAMEKWIDYRSRTNRGQDIQDDEGSRGTWIEVGKGVGG